MGDPKTGRPAKEEAVPEKRYPRLDITTRHRILSKILIRIYNNLTIRRIEKRDHYHHRKYDIVSLERARGKEDIEKHFLMMAVQLDHEKIDPVLYLKVLSNYGWFAKQKFLPKPKWLSSQKAADTFKWLARKERAKWFLDSDWKEHLESMTSPILDKERIASEIEASWKFLEAPLALGLDVGSSAIVHSNHLSPWFLAVCKPFLRMEGLEFIPDYGRKEVKSCMNALMRDRPLLKAAVKAYKEHSSA